MNNNEPNEESCGIPHTTSLKLQSKPIETNLSSSCMSDWISFNFRLHSFHFLPFVCNVILYFVN